jgi:DNA invertase Pin-like site-specific DNA recombinase
MSKPTQSEKRAVVYARVSTDEQDVDRQADNLLAYAREKGYPPADVEVLRDKSTGTNVDRPGYRRLMSLVDEQETEAVIVRSLSRLARSMSDLYRTVERFTDSDVGLYVRNDGLEIDPGAELTTGDKALLNALAFAAEIEADMIRERTIEGLRAAEQAGKWVGRPPYGFSTDSEGYLQPGENYRRAVEAIRAVEDVGMSVRRAARHTGVPRRTIPNILERKDLYLSEASE